MSVLLNFAIFPMDKGESGVSEYVSKVIEMIDKSGICYKLNPMGTTIETDTIKEALEIVEKSYEILAPYSERIYITANIDIRKERKEGISKKIASIEEKIGKVKS